MRNFEERKQEILRRADERIRRRKKIKAQLLGVGISMVCAAVCIIAFLPTNPYKQPLDMNQKEAMDAAPVIPDMPAESTSAASQESYDDMPAEAVAADAPMEDHSHAYVPAETMPWEIPPENKLRGTIGVHFTELDEVYVQVEELRHATGSLSFVYWNKSGEDVHLEYYDLVRWDGEKWSSCAVDGEKWRPEPYWFPSYMDEPAMGFNTTYSVFDFTKPGNYRFTATFRLGDDSTTYTMWAEFTLEEEEQP